MKSYKNDVLYNVWIWARVDAELSTGLPSGLVCYMTGLSSIYLTL